MQDKQQRDCRKPKEGEVIEKKDSRNVQEAATQIINTTKDSSKNATASNVRVEPYYPMFNAWLRWMVQRVKQETRATPYYEQNHRRARFWVGNIKKTLLDNPFAKGDKNKTENKDKMEVSHA